MTGEINLQGCNGHKTIGYRMEIGALACILPGASRPDPVHAFTLGIGHRNNRLGAMPATQARRLDAAQLVIGQIRNIDVERDATLNRLFKQPRNQLLRHLRSGVKIAATVWLHAEREGYCWQTEKTTFDCCRHSARIERVVAQICAVVDAGANQIEFEIKVARDGDVHAVSRCAAGNVMHPRLCLQHTQWHIKRQRIAGTAAIAIWRHDSCPGQRRKRRIEFADAFREITVVVADQNMHGNRGRIGGAQYTRSRTFFAERKPLDDEERQLFRQAMRGVRRLRVEIPVASTRKRPKPRARFARAARAAVLQEGLDQGLLPHASTVESGDALLFRRPEVTQSAFNRLRRGQFRVDAEIDLHGLTAAMVEPALREFLSDAMHQDVRVVRIIHGKGRRSGHYGPILRLVASEYLRQVGSILGFASARDADGGSGAILALLAARRR
jgi:DNA-nicking Smr family endonuclease